MTALMTINSTKDNDVRLRLMKVERMPTFRESGSCLQLKGGMMSVHRNRIASESRHGDDGINDKMRGNKVVCDGVLHI